MGETDKTPAGTHAVALFSGGLDSILAARLLMEQGLNVRCLHFVTPFFGKPELIPHWEAIYGLTIEAVDVGADFVRLLRRFPEHGYGKVMNPCVDCKILMMRKAREIMTALGASLIASGEVLGQRPMSQRRDTLNIISREAGVSGLLLRPLCARHLPPTDAERSGLADRARLGAIFGRGRREQLELAARMGLAEIPTPAGGCRLAEKENARRYWPVLTRLDDPAPADFALANVGRQFWREDAWLSMGRNEADNAALAGLLGLGNPDDPDGSDGPDCPDGQNEVNELNGQGASPASCATAAPALPAPFGQDAAVLRLVSLPGPLAVVRFVGAEARAAWRDSVERSHGPDLLDLSDLSPLPALPALNVLWDAAALLASYAPKAGSGEADVECRPVNGGPGWTLRVRPSRETGYIAGGPSFEEVKAALRRVDQG